MTRPEQRPEGVLIQRALDRLDLSIRAAAQRVDISDTRLRHIISGYEPLGSGNYREVVARPRYLARIAAELEITPEELEQASRSDAADILRERRRAPQRVAEVPDADLPKQIGWVRRQPWPPSEQQLVINELIKLAAEVEEERRSAAG